MAVAGDGGHFQGLEFGEVHEDVSRPDEDGGLGFAAGVEGEMVEGGTVGAGLSFWADQVWLLI